MACIPCQRKKNLDMEEKIKQLAASGFDANRIAAMLSVHKHIVVEALSVDSTVSTKKTKKSKSAE